MINGRDTLRDHKTMEFRAAVERLRLDGLNTVWQIDCREACTAAECSPANDPHTVRDGYVPEKSAILKYPIANGSAAVLNDHIREIGTASKRLAVDRLHTAGNGDAGKSGAPCKRLTSNGCDTVWYADAVEASAPLEHLGANDLDTSRN